MYNNLTILSLCSHHKRSFVIYGVWHGVISDKKDCKWVLIHKPIVSLTSPTQSHKTQLTMISASTRSPNTNDTIYIVSSYIFSWHGYWETEEKVILTANPLQPIPTSTVIFISSGIESILEAIKILEGNPLISSFLMKSN